MSIQHRKKGICVDDIKASVKENGWAALRLPEKVFCSLENDLLSVAKSFGTPISTRGRTLVDRLRPAPSSIAHAKSLSAVHGTGTQPWHMDMAHRTVPARFIILACDKTGVVAAATEITEWNNFLTR
ncbi:MAG: hypothetical protein ACLQHK_12795 [Gallionellaceae bacterium]